MYTEGSERKTTFKSCKNDGVFLDLRPSDLQARGFNSCGRSDALLVGWAR